MYKTLISSQAWDVPNSNLIVNLKQFKEYSWHMPNSNKIYYVAGVSIRSRMSTSVGYSMFNEQGDDAYGAFENLMMKIDKVVDVMFRIIDACDNPDSIEVVKDGYGIMPLMNDDFPVKFFSSASRMVSLMEKSKKDFSLFIRRHETDNRHVTNYGVITVGDEVVFKGKPAYDRKDVMTNVKLAVLGAAVMLEKFQGMAWNVMIDNGNPDYDVVMNGLGHNLNLKSNKSKKENGNAGTT